MSGELSLTAAVLAARASAAARLPWRATWLRYGYDVCACLLLALPLRNATVASGIAALPDAARAFHTGGGLWLLEVLHGQQASLLASLAPAFWALLLLNGLALLPEWWLLRQLALASGAPEVPPRSALTRLAALALGTWVLRGAGWLGAVLLASLLRSRLQSAPDERVGDVAGAAVLALTLLLQLGVSLLRDLVAVRLVRHRQRLLAALGHGARQLRAAAASLTPTYGGVRGLGLLVLLGAHGLSVALDQRGHGELCLLAVLLGLGVRVVLDTLWLRWLMARAA